MYIYIYIYIIIYICLNIHAYINITWIQVHGKGRLM